MFRPGDEPTTGYRLEEMLGRGAFGEVWRATGPGDTSVALKLINLHGKHGSKEFRAVQKVKEIRHAHLLPVAALWILDQHGNLLDISQLQSTPQDPDILRSALQQTASPVAPRPTTLVVAMLLGDKSLADRLEECRRRDLSGIPVAELLDYMEDAARGIDYLNSPRHDLGAGPVAIQHCDVKPQNIMLVGDSALVCDFGVARVLGDTRASTALAGSPAYMPPECIETKHPSHASDQYSLAVSYCELRTGELPFAEESYVAVINAHLRGQLDLSRLPPGEQAVIRRATAVDPQQRYPTTLQMVRALCRAVEAEGVATPAVGPPIGSGAEAGGHRQQVSADASADAVGQAAEARGPAAPPAPSEQFELRVRIGRNAYGTVYRGWDRKLNRNVAIMELHEKFLGDPGRMETSWSQVIELAGLSHDRIVQVLAGEQQLGWIVMELLNGNLAEKLKDGPLAPGKVRRVVRQALEALQFLHAHDRLHGDVRPATILLGPQGQIKLSFSVGIALCGEIPWELRSQKYVAPELLNPQFGPVGPGADLYSLGFSALELLVGPRFDELFLREGQGLEAVWARQHGSPTESIPPARDLVPGAPADLADVIDRLLLKPVDQRYASAAEPLDDLPGEPKEEELPPGQSTVARHRQEEASATLPSSAPVQTWRRTRTRPKQASRRPAVLAALALVVLITVGTLGWLVHYRPELLARHTPDPLREYVPRSWLPQEVQRPAGATIVAGSEDGKAEPRSTEVATGSVMANGSKFVAPGGAEQADAEEAISSYERGIAQLRDGDFSAAIASLDEAIRLDPQSARAYARRGFAHAELGHSDQAMADYTEALRIDPEYAEAYNNRGCAYREQGDLRSALVDFTEAIRLKPNEAKTFVNRGLTYLRQQDLDRSIADFTEAIQLDPKLADAHCLRGRAYAANSDFDRALRDSTDAILLDPKFAEAYRVRGRAHAGRRDYQKAIADYSQAIRLDPQYAEAYAGRGQAYQASGESRKAQDDDAKRQELEDLGRGR